MSAAAAATFRLAGLGGIADAIQAWFAEPANTVRSHQEFVEFLGDVVLNERVSAKEQALVRRAQLPNTGRLSDVLPWMKKHGLRESVLRNLAEGTWLTQGQHVVLTGRHGCGKTTLAAALAREAIARRRDVRYERLPELLGEVCLAGETHAVEKLMRALIRPHLLVLDDFTEEPAAPQACYALRRIVDARHRAGKSLLVVASAPIDEWDGFFADPTARSSVFARLLGRAISLEFND